VGTTKDPFPDSNVEQIVFNLVNRANDLDGKGLVDLLGLLKARAEQVQYMRERLSQFGRETLYGDVVPDKAQLDAEMLEGLCETSCLKWFLACACKRLSEDLEHEVHQKQSTIRRISKIVFTEDGGVESFRLDPNQT
jgi:hypothetical protein